MLSRLAVPAYLRRRREAGVAGIPPDQIPDLEFWVDANKGLDNPNLLLRTDRFDHSAWVKTGGATVTPDVEPGPPDVPSGTDADQINAAGIGSYIGQSNVVALLPGTPYTGSIYIKAAPGHNGTSNCRIGINDGFSPAENLDLIPTASWQRVDLTLASLSGSATNIEFTVHPDIDLGTEDVIVIAAQLQVGSVVTDYAFNNAVRGGMIDSWPDQSGNARHAVQATQAAMPLLSATALDGKPGVVFDGIDDFVQSTFGTTLTQPNTQILVCRLESHVSGTKFLMDGLTSGAKHQMYTLLVPPRVGLNAGSAATIERDIVGDPTVWSAVFDGATSDIRFDGVSQDGLNPASQSTAGATLGARYDGTVGQANVTVFAAMTYSRRLTVEEMNSIEKYYNNIYPSLGIVHYSLGDPRGYLGLEAYFRPEQLPSPGNLVETWEDQSGKSNDLGQPTESKRPVVAGNVFGSISAARFDGIDNWLQLTTIPTGDKLSPWTAFVVVNNLDISSESAPFGALTAGQTCRFATNGTSTLVRGATVVTILAASTVQAATPAVFMAQRGAGDLCSGRWNGSGLTDQAWSAVDFELEIIGAGGNGAGGQSRFLDGDIGSFVWFSRDLTDKEMNEIDAFLFDEFGITP